MYASRWRMFIGIGFLTVPASLVVAALQSLILGGSGEEGGFRVVLAALVGFLVIGTTILLVLAATTHALGEIDRGRRGRRPSRLPARPRPVASAARSPS